MSRTSPSSQENDGGRAQRKQSRLKGMQGHQPGKGLTTIVMREVKSVGRYRDRYYDPVTGRRRTQ